MPRAHLADPRGASEAGLFAWLEDLLGWLAPWLAAKLGPDFDPDG